MAATIIGYENVYLGSNVSLVVASASDASYPVANATDYRTHTFWRGSGVGSHNVKVVLNTIDHVAYYALAKHNMFSAGYTTRLQASINDFTTTVNLTSAKTHTSDAPFMETFDQPLTAYDYYRILIEPIGTPTESPQIGILSVGPKMIFPFATRVGFSIPNDAQAGKIINQISESGQFIGRSVIRQGIAAQMNFAFLTEAFIQNNWRAFRDHANTTPFWIAWNPDNPDEVVYAWTRGFLPAPRRDTLKTWSTTLPFNGIAL